MSRPIWKGHISFGLVNIPVTLHTAENHNELQFRQLDGRNHAKVRYQRVNDLTGEDVPWDAIVKAYEQEDGTFVVVEDEELKAIAPEQTQTVEIEDFVDASDVDLVYHDRPYYLAPGKKGDKGYALLREALRQTGKAGIAKVVLRTRQYVGLVQPWKQVLVLELLRYHDEVKSPTELELPSDDLEAMKVTKKELDMAVRLVESMSTAFDPARYRDEFREKVLAWIQRKAAGGATAAVPVGTAEDAEAQGNVIDFMDLLKKSLEKKAEARPAKRGGAVKAEPDSESEAVAPARKKRQRRGA